MQVDHTFVICAYKQSDYLEDCIKSIQSQSVLGKVIITTSTPNEFIRNLSEKYDIPLYINNAPSSISGDWNYGVSKVKTKYFTLGHQDDVYKKDYLKKALQYLESSGRPLIFFSNYSELRGNQELKSSTLLNIKRFFLYPLRLSLLSNKKWIRRRILSFGNSICCPSVTFCKENLPEVIFSSKFKCNLDWLAWENISRIDGDFLYSSNILMSHRIHEESTTTELIENNVRYEEDFEMFKIFWPQWIAYLIMRGYSKSQNSNKTF